MSELCKDKLKNSSKWLLASAQITFFPYIALDNLDTSKSPSKNETMISYILIFISAKGETLANN